MAIAAIAMDGKQTAYLGDKDKGLETRIRDKELRGSDFRGDGYQERQTDA